NAPPPELWYGRFAAQAAPAARESLRERSIKIEHERISGNDIRRARVAGPLEPDIHLIQRAGRQELKAFRDRIQIAVLLVRPERVRRFPEDVEMRIWAAPILAVVPFEIRLRIVRHVELPAADGH